MNRVYFCIDLKTFFASVECVERGLDPFKTDLIVADSDRGKGSICLAISPSMKNKGIKNYSQASSQNICNNKISTGF